jgi:hypothetical protein
MKKAFLALIGSTAVFTSCGLAQTSTSADKTVSTAQSQEDAEWDDLRGAGTISIIPGVAEAKDERSLKQAFKQHGKTLAANADRARDFASRHPGHPKAAEARRLEALLLLQAVQAGDVSLAARMNATVESVRKDQNVPEPIRAEIAGLADFSDATHAFRNAADRALGFEVVARGLITEFPYQPQGYESLLTIAREAEDAKGRALAAELRSMAAPPAVKEGADFLLKRYDLVGQPLSALLTDEAAKAALAEIKPDSATLLYTWATWSPGSLALANDLAARKVPGVVVLALNLDQDVAAAKEQARSHALPGTQIYDAESTAGSLARRLGINGAPYVYLIDADGVVRDVKGVENLEQKLAKLGR